MEYYINLNGSSIGPMNHEQMLAYNVNEQTPVSRDGINWAPLYTYPELMDMIYRRGRTDSQIRHEDVSQKKLICGILAILVGTLGVHYFVLGKVSGGIYCILLSLVTCGLWGIVTLIQGILMLCMSDQDFEQKYMNTPKSFPLF
ncbi:MAG: NINE protein [Muribaculaceae bacterium]|nr:NINE protein [Muribaculaceae bacterium]